MTSPSLWARSCGSGSHQTRSVSASSRHWRASPIYLDLSADLLINYPWELLRDAEGNWLLNQTRICLGRPERRGGALVGTPPPSEHPLRVLVVLGNGAMDKEIRADEELVAIEAAAHTKNEQVLLRTLLRPTPEQIKIALDEFKPHVFHFIGHGARPLQGPPEVHVWDRTSGQYDPWRADRIRDVFRDSPPRLVVLNACLTDGSPTVSTSLVNAFLGAGSMAVIAMLGEIRGDASLFFSRCLYAEPSRGTRSTGQSARLGRHSPAWRPNGRCGATGSFHASRSPETWTRRS